MTSLRHLLLILLIVVLAVVLVKYTEAADDGNNKDTSAAADSKSCPGAKKPGFKSALTRAKSFFRSLVKAKTLQEKLQRAKRRLDAVQGKNGSKPEQVKRLQEYIDLVEEAIKAEAALQNAKGDDDIAKYKADFEAAKKKVIKAEAGLFALTKKQLIAVGGACALGPLAAISNLYMFYKSANLMFGRQGKPSRSPPLSHQRMTHGFPWENIPKWEPNLEQHRGDSMLEEGVVEDSGGIGWWIAAFVVLGLIFIASLVYACLVNDDEECPAAKAKSKSKKKSTAPGQVDAETPGQTASTTASSGCDRQSGKHPNKFKGKNSNKLNNNSKKSSTTTTTTPATTLTAGTSKDQSTSSAGGGAPIKV